MENSNNIDHQPTSTDQRKKRLNPFNRDHELADNAIDQVLQAAGIIFNNTTEGILITNLEGIIQNVNPGFSLITGFQAEEVIGFRPSILKSNRHEKKFYENIFISLKSNGRWEGEIWNRRKNGEIYPEWLTIFVLEDSNVEESRYIGIFSDITNTVNKNDQHNNHAYYDMLTGLPNRLLLHDRLQFMLNHAKRNQNYMAILLLDVNRFKMINDTLGYSAGDSLLQIVGSRLKSCLREVDTVFRSGDDEFAMILDEINMLEDAAKVAKRILSACALPFNLFERELYVTVSIGISLFPNDSQDHEGLLKNAEDAMLRAKELGINNYQHYKPAMNNHAFEQLNLEHNLRKAILQDEFVVYYQPLVDLKTNKISGAEALVRWKHPELGMISPGQFIPIAEETGLILPLGELVLRTACSQMKKWKEQFGKDLIIAVNLSARQFQQQDVVSTINNILNEVNLPATWLELEITESLGMKNPELTLRILQELKEMGIHISIDDFGTGYSSLSYLKKFPIDTLKIDRSFVSEIQTDPNDAAIVLAIIALAHSMKLKVIAEGVELKEQSDFLASHGCELMQGYLFSPPVPADTFEKLLKEHL